MNETEKRRTQDIHIGIEVHGLDEVLSNINDLWRSVEDIQRFADVLVKSCSNLSVSIDHSQQEENACEQKADFKLLCALIDENPNMSLGEIIGMLEMCNIPMTDAVRRLGVCAGVLYK